MVTLGWLVAGCLLLVAAWLWMDLNELRQATREQQIRAEEAQAWADEYGRERDVMEAECYRLRDQVRTLQALYARRTRESLAANFWIVAKNVEWKRRID